MTAPTRAPLSAGERLFLRSLAAAATYGLVLAVFAVAKRWLDPNLQGQWLLVLLLLTFGATQFFAFRRPPS